MQDSKERVHEILQGQNAESQGIYSTVASAVSSAGSAIGQLGNQILGAGEASPAGSNALFMCYMLTNVQIQL